MAPLTQNRNNAQISDDPISSKLNLSVAASTHLYQGSMVGVNSAGNLTKAVAPVPAGGLVLIGRIDKEKDNSLGAAGALTGDVTQGSFKWDNSGTDPITVADLGFPCYFSDDHTVCRTDSAGTRPYGGIVQGVDSDGVIVETRLTSKGSGKGMLTFAIDLASIPAGNAISFKPGYAGRITRVEFSVAKPATTTAKLATLTPNIAGTPVTGGVVALTSANCTPSGSNVAGSTVTAANQFGAQDTITVVGSAITAFVEGSGTLIIYTE